MTRHAIGGDRGAMPHVIVCAGGGGVGKTTTAAALAVAIAASGRRTLIVTIDPARRLAGAMGVSISDVVTEVPIAATGGRLYALMPDPRRSMHAFVATLFEHEPEAHARVLTNRLFLGLADAAAGVHELVAMNLVARASADGAFEVVVIDTAPSRHAIDFVTYPGRLASLLGGRTVGWLAGLAERAGDSGGRGGIFAWGAERVEGLLARITGPNLLRDTASLFGELALVREPFVDLAERAATLLLGDRAAYVLVAAPTAAAREDVVYLDKRLRKLGRVPRALVLNQADSEAAPYLRTLLDAPDVDHEVAAAARALDAERQRRSVAATQLARELAVRVPGAAVVRLPHIEAARPSAIVMALSDALGPFLTTFLSSR